MKTDAPKPTDKPDAKRELDDQIVHKDDENKRVPIPGALENADSDDSKAPTPGKKLAEDAPAPKVFPDGTSNGIDAA